MNDNPYAAPPGTTYATTDYDPLGESPPLTVGHLTFALVCGVLITVASLLGFAAVLVQWLGSDFGSIDFRFFVHRLITAVGPAIAFGLGTWQLWLQRKATAMKNAGTIGWPQYTLQHNRFWKTLTIAILTLFAFRVLNSAFVAIAYW